MQLSFLYGQGFHFFENSNKVSSSQPIGTNSILGTYAQDMIFRSALDSTYPSLLSTTFTSPSLDRSVRQTSLRAVNSLQHLINAPRQESAVQIQTSEEMTLDNMEDELLNQSVDLLLNPQSSVTHLKIDYLSIDNAWKLLAHFRFRESNLRTLSIEGVDSGTIVILMNVFIKSLNKVQTLNLRHLSPDETREMLPSLLDLNCKITELGVEDCSFETVLELLPLLRARDCTIKRLKLKNTPPAVVDQLLGYLWDAQRTRNENLSVEVSNIRFTNLAERIDAFNNLRTGDRQSQAVTIPQPQLHQDLQTLFTSPILNSASTTEVQEPNRSKRKIKESDSLPKPKKAKK